MTQTVRVNDTLVALFVMSKAVGSSQAVDFTNIMLLFTFFKFIKLEIEINVRQDYQLMTLFEKNCYDFEYGIIGLYGPYFCCIAKDNP